MILLKGAEVSAKLKNEVARMAARMEGHVPTLAIVRVGERPDDLSYERGAMKRMEAFGLRAVSRAFDETIPAEDFLRELGKINGDPEVDGILLLKPLPPQLDEAAAASVMNPDKDLDGICPENMAKVFAGDSEGFAPCTAEAVMEILKAAGIDPAGKRVTIVGRSNVVGKPLAMLMLGANATVTVCHTKTKDLPGTCKNAEILVAAAGRAGVIGRDHVAPGTVVVDVGIHVDENGKLCGDVDLASIEDLAAAATPVPGGVGAVTTAVLARHLVRAALRQRMLR